MKSKSVKQLELQIYRELNEITPEPVVDLRTYNANARNTKLHRIVNSKLNRMRQGARFIY